MKKIEPYEGEQPYIFVSYSHKDSKKVFEILNRLAQMGYRIWYDEGIEWGTEWPDNIAQHLVNSSAFLAFHSENSAESANCRREIFYATRNSKPIFSVFLEDVQFPLGLEMELSLYQSSNYYQYPEDQKKDFYDRIERTSILLPSREEPEVKPIDEESIKKIKEKKIVAEESNPKEPSQSEKTKKSESLIQKKQESNLKELEEKELKISKDKTKTFSEQKKTKKFPEKLNTKILKKSNDNVSPRNKSDKEEDLLIEPAVSKSKSNGMIKTIGIFFIAIILSIIIIAILSDDQFSSTPVISDSATTTATNLYTVGSTYTCPIQGITVTLDSVQEHTGKAANVPLPEKGNVYLILTFTVSNQSSLPIKDLVFTGYLNNKQIIDRVSISDLGTSLGENIPVGANVTGTVIYEIPGDWTEFSEKVKFLTAISEINYNEYDVVFYVTPSQVIKAGGEVK